MSLPTRAVVLAADPAWRTEVCGLTLLERLLRALQRSGIRRATVWTGGAGDARPALARPSWARAELGIEIEDWPEGGLTTGHLARGLEPGEDAILLVEAARLLDLRLLGALVARGTGSTLLVDSAPPPDLAPLIAGVPRHPAGWSCGAARLERQWLEARDGDLDREIARGLEDGSLGTVDVAAEPVYLKPLRRELRPLWFAAPAGEAERREIERRVIDSAQKKVLDFPALVHAPIESFLVARLCRTSITPNQISLIGSVVAWIATWLFATGRLGAGVALAMAVGVIDGVDGKQARVKLETTRLGRLEHKLDGLFELSWLLAIPYGLARSGALPTAGHWLLAFLAAEAIDGIAKLLCLRRTDRELDDQSPLDRAVRVIAGRRNVDVWIFAAAVIAGYPAAGFQAVTIWELLTAAWHLPRALWLTRRAAQAGRAVPS